MALRSVSLIEDGRFFLPGPTQVHPDVLRAQARPLISHRGPQMRGIMAEIQTGLRHVLQTRRPVAISTSSATGLMEAGVRSSGVGRILCLVGGAFSQRFAEIANRSGLQVEVVEVPWGEAHDPDDVGKRVAECKPDLVTMVHSETSTGVLNPVGDLAAAVRGHSDALIVVDSVSAAAGVAVRPDEWKADLLLTGSQKAFALPPGLSFAVASERFVDRVATNDTRGFYFDLSAHYRSLAEHQTPTTPAITLLYALHEQLGRIRQEGIGARFERHVEMAQDCYRWLERVRDRGVDIKVVAPEGRRSPTVTAVRLPVSTSSGVVVKGLGAQGYSVATGYGKWGDDHIRLGHMGDHSRSGFSGLLEVLEAALVSSG